MKSKKDRTIKSDLYLKVKQALENEKYSFRTIEGVAKETRLNKSQVEKAIINHNDEVVILHRKGSQGERLVTTRSHYSSKASLKEKLMGVMLNRVY
jgi:hypothetical protein